MTETAMTYREEKRAFRETLAMRNALARIARRRWPTNGIKLAMQAWKLTEGEARNLYYGNCSANAFDKAIAAGRWSLLLEIGALMLGETVDEFAKQEAERLAHEHAQAVANARRLMSLASDSGAVGGVGDHRSFGARRQQNGGLGGRPGGEA